MNDVVIQMAAMTSALRMLLAGHDHAKPSDVMILASSGVSDQLLEVMMAHAAERRSTILAIFDVDEEAALLSKVMVIDASTTDRQIYIGGGRFVEMPDGGYAVLSNNQENRYAYVLSKRGRLLERRCVENVDNQGVIALLGVKALVAKAATAKCQAEARTVTINRC